MPTWAEFILISFLLVVSTVEPQKISKNMRTSCPCGRGLNGTKKEEEEEEKRKKIHFLAVMSKPWLRFEWQTPGAPFLVDQPSDPSPPTLGLLDPCDLWTTSAVPSRKERLTSLSHTAPRTSATEASQPGQKGQKGRFRES